MKQCFGYIRVSTQKQGEGASLEAQKDAIESFASRNDLVISKWFEEKETAAKCGRPVFSEMVKQLKRQMADGLIIHKIDRSARNHRDWADIGDLSDAGIDIHFATETLDFRSRGGRLTADIQAVIAADYVRNLREECKKGLNGRLKQGLYPFKAPLGYLDHGGGKPKTICPRSGPLVKLAFEMYASRQYSYLALLEEMHQRGLRNSRGGKLTVNGLSKIFANQFYIGVIHIKTSGNSYKGVHEPLISATTSQRVQAIKGNRCGPKITRHNHQYQGLFHCDPCKGPMVPELQKGQVYYRCKRLECPTKTIREDSLDTAVRSKLAKLQLSPRAKEAVSNEIARNTAAIEDQRASTELQIKDEEKRLDRLQDLLLDEQINVDAFKTKENQIQIRLLTLKEKLEKLPDLDALKAYRSKLAELRNSLVYLYDMANRREKREIIENVWPNRSVREKNLLFEPYNWVLETDFGGSVTYGAPERDACRTLIDLLEKYGTQQSDQMTD